jgi:putative flippase GtrA
MRINRVKLWQLFLQMTKSCGVGVSGNGINCVILYICKEVFGIRLVFSKGVAVIPYFCWCFFWNKFKVFRNMDKEKIRKQMAEYAALRLALALADWAMLIGAVNLFHAHKHYILVQIGVAIVGFFPTFFISRNKIFAK